MVSSSYFRQFVNSSSLPVAVPDGSQKVSFPLSCYSTYSLSKPTSSDVILGALFPCPEGSVALMTGKCSDVPANKYANATDLTLGGQVSHNFDDSSTTDGYFLFPHTIGPYPVTSSGKKPWGSYSATEYRCLGYTYEFTFTGPTLQDQGTIAIGRTTYEPTTLSETRACNSVDTSTAAITSPIGFNNPLAIAGAVVTSVRKPLRGAAINTRLEWTPILSHTQIVYETPTGGMGNALTPLTEPSTAATAANACCTGFDPNVSTTLFRIEGLDSNASVLLHVRAHYEFAISPGSAAAAFSGPNPPDEPSFAARLRAFADKLPVAEIISGSLRGASMLMA